MAPPAQDTQYMQPQPQQPPQYSQAQYPPPQYIPPQDSQPGFGRDTHKGGEDDYSEERDEDDESEESDEDTDEMVDITLDSQLAYAYPVWRSVSNIWLRPSGCHPNFLLIQL